MDITLCSEEISLLNQLDDPDNSIWRIYIEFRQVTDPQTGIIKRSIAELPWEHQQIFNKIQLLSDCGLVKILSEDSQQLLIHIKLYLPFGLIKTNNIH